MLYNYIYITILSSILILFQVHPDAQYVKWDYFSQLLEIDRKNPSGRLCPKLTSEHVNPNNLLKMRVFLAVQVILFIKKCIIKFMIFNMLFNLDF